MIQMLKKFRIVLLCIAVLAGISYILYLDNVGIAYQIQQPKSEALPQSVIDKKKERERTPKTCLVLRDSSQENSDIFTNNVTDTLSIMRVGYEVVDLAKQPVPKFDAPYKTAVITMQNLEVLGESVEKMCDWVEQDGAGVMFYCTPDSSPVFRYLSSKLGIVEGGVSYTYIEGIKLQNGMMLGGDGMVLHWGEPMPTALSVSLQPSATAYAVSDDEHAAPLVWSNQYGKGRFVVNNHGFTDKASRGLIGAAYNLLEDVSVHPVINASTFFLDDFPSPVPMGDGEYIRKEFGRDISSFYSAIWWPDMLSFCDNYGIKFTGLVIEDYDDKVDGTFPRQTDTERFMHFGSLLLDNGGEIGIHGYNHQPICFTGFVYDEMMDYNPWPSEQNVTTAMKEVHDFTVELFPEVKPQVYVPPSNVLSKEGRAMFKKNFPYIKTIASLYLDSENGYSQEFEIAEDGIVEFPRVISGAVMDQYMYWDAMGALNLYYVNSHFIHPDDVLDTDRGAALGWKQLHKNLDDYMKWLYNSAPSIRNTTGTEASNATERFDTLSIERTDDEEHGKITLRLDGFWDEAYLMVRFNKGKPGKVDGGTIENVNGQFYLLKATSDIITIQTK